MGDDGQGREAALTRMAGLMGEAMEAAAAGQALTFALLQAEFEALARLMPGAAPAPAAEEAEDRRRADEARIETDLDNLPL